MRINESIIWFMMRTSSQLPWWVTAVYKVGVPTAIACYLVWLLAAKVQDNLQAIQGEVTQHILDQQLSSQTSKQTLVLLRIICSEGAKSVEERNACFQ
jgi:hypothetical protein